MIGCSAILSIFAIVIGLFTFNWPIFLLLFILNVLIGRIQTLNKTNLPAYLGLARISYLTGGIGLIFSALNSYHFQIDFFELIKTLF